MLFLSPQSLGLQQSQLSVSCSGARVQSSAGARTQSNTGTQTQSSISARTQSSPSSRQLTQDNTEDTSCTALSKFRLVITISKSENPFEVLDDLKKGALDSQSPACAQQDGETFAMGTMVS